MIRLAGIFQDHMTFQREKEIILWGETDYSQIIRVYIDGNAVCQTEIQAGTFRIRCPKQPAMENVTLVLKGAPGEECTLRNVDIGEVWIAAGQSNMEFVMKWETHFRQEKKSFCEDEHLRFYDVPKLSFLGEEKDGFVRRNGRGVWQLCREKNLGYFPAAAYYFARFLKKTLKVPAGIIGCNWSGTSEPALGPHSPGRPGALYHNMVEKIAGFSIRGVLWYQGEADDSHAELYGKLFTELIKCWRRSWGYDLPFLFVQLAPFKKWLGEVGDRYPILRKQQEKVSKTVKDTWMTSIMDAGMEYDIHPKDKKTVGRRLALLALGKIYGTNCGEGLYVKNGMIQAYRQNHFRGMLAIYI